MNQESGWLRFQVPFTYHEHCHSVYVWNILNMQSMLIYYLHKELLAIQYIKLLTFYSKVTNFIVIMVTIKHYYQLNNMIVWLPHWPEHFSPTGGCVLPLLFEDYEFGWNSNYGYTGENVI